MRRQMTWTCCSSKTESSRTSVASRRSRCMACTASQLGDLVTAHLISGPDIVDGCMAAWADVGRSGGVLLLAQMSSRGNLLAGAYSDAVVAHGREHDGVMGFIGNGSRPEELRDLRGRVGEGRMIWTPGVNLDRW